MIKTKKIVTLIAAAVIGLSAFTVQAQELESIEAPTLTSISFTNAVINEKFSPTVSGYTLTLDDPGVTPTLEDYEINGSAKIFVTYNDDGANHQTGVSVTLEYDGGSTVYTFEYSNAQTYEITSNNLLESASCYLGEIHPKINDDDTEYKLYIPKDLTTIRMSAATKDISACCDMPAEITLSEAQEPTVTLTVTASDGSERIYTFKVKRINKTSEQVEKEMEKSGYTSMIDGEFFYQKPIFFIVIASTAVGIAVILVLSAITKRLIVKTEDDDEKEFFDIV